jgi:hypothetical protein
VKSWPCCGSVGYLRVVEIAWVHSRRWAGTLVVTAVAALIAGSASSALAQTGGAGPASTPTVEAKPLPSAGWHGRPIRRPYKAHTPSAPTAQPPGGAAPRLGAGYDRANGSAEVRSLRFRDGPAAGTDRQAAAHSSVMASPPAWQRADASPTLYDERHNGRGVIGQVLLALTLALALTGLALLARVTGGLDHLAHSPRRLRALLEWCAGHAVDLVAVDVGLDTSKHDGRLVAGRLLAAVRNGGVHDARPTAPRRRRADTRNGSRDRRDEPIAAQWHRKRPWR